jgi:catechol 2,3-dioxygenase-like lactoylglutathione lyase family enzyme
MSGGPRLALDHVQVAAPPGREDDARRFYGGLLGLPELEKPPALAADGAWFALCSGALNVGMTDAFAPAAKAHPGLRAESVKALDELAGRLAGAGYAVEWDDRLPGHRRFYTRDPFGNRLELLAADGVEG